MKKKPHPPISSTEDVIGLWPVSRESVHRRTQELAAMAGRDSLQVVQADYEQAKRELVRESDRARQDALLEAAHETKRWNPLPG